MNFSIKLRLYREIAGYSAKELADLVGIKYTTYLNYENAGTEPRYEILRKLADTLHVSVDELIGAENTEDKLQRYYRRLRQLGFTVIPAKNPDSNGSVFFENKEGIISAIPPSDFIKLMDNIESSNELLSAEYDIYNAAIEEYKNTVYKSLIDWIKSDTSESAQNIRNTFKKAIPDFYQRLMTEEEPLPERKKHKE